MRACGCVHACVHVCTLYGALFLLTPRPTQGSLTSVFDSLSEKCKYSLHFLLQRACLQTFLVLVLEKWGAARALSDTHRPKMLRE